MARFGGLGFGGWSVARDTRFLVCLVGVWAVLSGAVVVAQEAPTPQDEPIHTLHVYANLLQIPTVVLGPYLDQIKKPIPESRFSVSIDSGPWFRATHVRLEGDDPISLSILLDVHGDTAELMPKIGDAIAGLAPLSLHPVDRVSVYALDCSLIRSWNNVPAENMGLKVAVSDALQSWTSRRGNKDEPKCQQRFHLWDALAYVVGELSQLPGRRVILVVSDGQDKDSRRPWNEVRANAQYKGVAVFGMTDVAHYMVGVGHVVGVHPAFQQLGTEDPFQALCQLSGGLVLSTSKQSIEETLRRFTTILRGRYIVEFPRPGNSTAGEHDMQVRVEKSGNDFIRPAGISVPIPDAAVLADPTTVPSDPSLTPQEGNRHPVTAPR